MSLAQLERLSQDGLAGFPVTGFGDLALWCWDWCEATGDGRYCSISYTLAAVNRWWDQYGVVPQAIAAEIDVHCREELALAVAAMDHSEGVYFARLFRQKVVALLRPPEDWATSDKGD